MADARTLLQQLSDALPTFAFSFGNEKQMQDGLAEILAAAGIGFRREHVASPHDRFDFLLDGGVVIEAKIKGSFSAAMRQAARYCQRDEVSAVLVVTTRFWGKPLKVADGALLYGKPVRVVQVGGAAF